MPGGFSMTPFDGSSKGDWFAADMNALFYTWAAINLGGVLLAAFLWQITGVNLLAPFGYVFDFMKENWGENYALWTMAIASFIIPFLLVFTFRRNCTVMGPRRQFRYFCRWC